MKPGLIYVDLESLMDLRQGHLALKADDPNAVSDYLLSEDYNFRETDDLKFSTRKDYKAAIQEADVALLENSTITHILSCVLQKIEGIENRNKYYSETLVPEVVLNLFPFILSEARQEHIRNLLFYKLGSSVKISITRMEPSDVSPLFFKTANVIAAFIYDFSEWMATHGTSIEKLRIHDTLLYTPALYVVKPTEEEFTKIAKLGFKDPLAYTTYLLSPSMSLNFLPVVFYSHIVVAATYLERFQKEANQVRLDAEESTGDVDSRPTV